MKKPTKLTNCIRRHIESLLQNKLVPSPNHIRTSNKVQGGVCSATQAKREILASSLLQFMDVHKNANRERGQYPTVLTELAWWIKDLLCRAFVLLCVFISVPVFVAKCILETHQYFCFLCFYSLCRFGFFRFLVPTWQRNHRQSLAAVENIFRKKTFVHPLRR